VAGNYPPVWLECRDGPQRPGCGYRWESTGAPGSTIKCPRCGKGARMPADRPRTATQARMGAAAADDGEGGRLARLWADQMPAANWRTDRESDAGRPCPDCGAPLHWIGAHTMQLCDGPQHPRDRGRRYSSPGAVKRERQLAEARAQRSTRAEIGPASPGELSDAESIELERRKGGLIAQLDGLDGDHLTPDVRRVLAWFRRQVDTAEREARLDELVELFDETGIRVRRSILPWQSTRLALDADEYEYDDADEYDDDGQADDADQARALREAPLCEPCQASGQRRTAVKRVTLPGSPGRGIDVCADHLAGYGPGASVVTSYGEPHFWAQWDATAAARAGAVPAPVPGYVPPDPNWRAKASPAELAYWNAITGKPAPPAVARAIRTRGGR
jgi:endogenous inhibitor of DNA gyrase (YacG/DUF329 family)